MKTKVTIILNEPNSNFLLDSLKVYEPKIKTTKSITAIETITLIISIFDLVLALLSNPILCDAINNKKVILKINGYEIKGSVDEIIKIIKENPDFMTELKRALENDNLQINGNAKYSIELHEKIKYFIEEEKNEQ